MTVDYDRLREERLATADPMYREMITMMPPLEEIGIEGMRAIFDAVVGGQPVTPGVTIRDETVSGPYGDIPVRVHTPDGVEGPMGVYMHVHAGGFIAAGGHDTWDGPNSAIAAGARCIVVAPDFKLPPEHKYPVGLEECWAVLNWIAGEGDDQGWDGDRIAIGGGCTGGNFSAVLALMARDAGAPTVSLQVLQSFPADGHFDTDSQREFADGYGLRYIDNAFVFAQYLDNVEEQIDDWRISPMLATSHADVAPALITVGEWDILLDEDVAYGDRLRDAGVEVTTHISPKEGHLPNPATVPAFTAMLCKAISEALSARG